MKKTAYILILAFLLSAALAPRCLAQGDDAPAETTPPPVSVETPEYAQSEYSVVDAAAFDALLAPFMDKYKLSEENFALAFYYSGTGETYFYNADRFMVAGSLYKVPMCMLVAEKVSRGELSQDGVYAGYKINTIERRCIINSDNDIAKVVTAQLAIEGNKWLPLVQYGGVALSELPENCCTDRLFTARQVLNTFLTLYNEPERFPNILDQLLNAQPTHYFRLYLEGKYEIAQKYGSLRGAVNAGGIIYTPHPIVLVVMTDHIGSNLELIGKVSEAVAAHTLTLDEKLTAAENAAAEAAAQAEADAAARELAAQQERERAAAEQERLAAQQAAAQTAQGAPSPTPTPAQTPRGDSAGAARTMLLIYGALAAALCLAALARLFLRRGRTRTRS